MLHLPLAALGLECWTDWVSLGNGIMVTMLVLGFTNYRRWRERRRLMVASREEDLPWDELLVLVQKRNRDRVSAGLPAQEATEEEFSQLLVQLPAVEKPRAMELEEDRDFAVAFGCEREEGRPRWGNPTEVHVRSLLSIDQEDDQLHGLVVNRSTGGLSIVADEEVSPARL